MLDGSCLQATGRCPICEKLAIVVVEYYASGDRFFSGDTLATSRISSLELCHGRTRIPGIRRTGCEHALVNKEDKHQIQSVLFIMP
jgi:hypothetical protein